MNLIELHNTKLRLQSDIQTASLLNENELVLLTCTGEVLLYNFADKSLTKLFETNPSKGVHYRDGGFAPSESSSIYTMDDIIVVVNNYKTHGFVLNRKEDYRLHIGREDYHADISKYPIALYKDDKDVPHLIYGVAWNRVDIVNLATRQVLTADKSLIEENAEQRHIDFYKKYEEHNKLLWPRGYDYFFGELILSPSKKKFLSAGWVWGSADACNLYDIEDFISNHRIKDYEIDQWEHNRRAICFMDDDTVATLYNPSEEGGEEDGGEDRFEIRLYHTDGEGDKGAIIPKTPLKLSGAALFYKAEAKCFYTFSDTIGLAAISLDGKILFHAPDFSPNSYEPAHDSFLSLDKKSIKVTRLQ